MTEEIESDLTHLFAQSVTQRFFIGDLLRQLALDVPSLNIGMLLERLHYQAEHNPNTPEEGSPEIQAAGLKELKRLIRMVEEVIEEVREK